MKTSKAITLAALTTLLLFDAAAIAEPEVQHVEVEAKLDAEWASYRYAYQAAAFIDKIMRKRPLIQAQMQLRPLDPDTPVTGLRVRLVGAKTNLELAADDIGRVTVPQLKQAFDEDAVLRLNRQKGLYKFSGRFSIRPHDDGIYAESDLVEACDQMISAQRDSGYRIRLFGKKCAGVKFVYRADDDHATVDLQATDGRVTPIVAVYGKPFEDDSMGTYRIVIVRFADRLNGGRIVTHEKPLAIGTLYE